MAVGNDEIYREIVKLAPAFRDLACVDEIWIANTSIPASERWASFGPMDGRGRVELLVFENAALKSRRDDRLPSAHRTANSSGASSPQVVPPSCCATL